MKSLFSKTMRAIRVARLWDRALQGAAQKKDEEALSYLAAIFKEFEGGMPSREVPYEINLLLAQVAIALENHAVGIEAITIVLTQLDSEKSLSSYERSYLRYYCKVLLEWSSLGSGFDTYLESKKINLTFDELRLDRVPKNTKINFPVSQAAPSEAIAGDR